MPVFTVEEAQEHLETLIERARAGEEIIISSEDGTALLEPWRETDSLTIKKE